MSDARPLTAAELEPWSAKERDKQCDGFYTRLVATLDSQRDENEQLRKALCWLRDQVGWWATSDGDNGYLLFDGDSKVEERSIPGDILRILMSVEPEYD